MNRKLVFLGVLAGFLMLASAPSPVLAQNSATFAQEQLDQMLAPIALYPDSLLAQMLVAATFPAEVVEADQWVRQDENLRGDQLNDALDRMDWDLSVKALVPFPKVLSMMSDKREWTQSLGDAFLDQQTNVMDTIQSLRAKAYAQGNLITNDEQRVVVKGDYIEIQPVNPRIVYVPAYNPQVIYGSWWYPAYPPYAYSPYYPNYMYSPDYNGYGFITSGLFGFAAGIAVGSGWHHGWGSWDWDNHHMRVNASRNININRDYRWSNMRTTDLNRVEHRRIGSAGRGEMRDYGRRDHGDRPSAASVSRDLNQRHGQSRDGHVRSAAETDQNRVRSERSRSADRSSAQTQRTRSSERSRGEVAQTRSSDRSRGDMRQTRSSERSRGEVGQTRSSDRSRGEMRQTRSPERSRGEMGQARSSERSHGQMGQARSSERSHGQMGQSRSSEKSQGQMGQSRSSERSQGQVRPTKFENSGGGNSDRGGSNRGGGNSREGSGSKGNRD